MKNQIPKDIVFTFFAGNASVLQKKLIEEWLADPANVEIYFEWLQEWETNQPQFLPDSNQAFEKFSRRTAQAESGDENQDEDEAPSPAKLVKYFDRGKWAAVFLMALGIGSYSVKDAFFIQTYQTSYKNSQTIILPDSSKIVLNANSRLRVPRWGFGSLTREVMLEGDAEFVVTHTVDNKPFMVRTPDNSKVTVLGTEFVVYARHRGTSVVLNKGKVQLASATDPKPRDMKPGDKATINLSGNIKIEKLSQEELATPAAWKQHQFKFQRTPLSAAATEMNEVFGVSIVIHNPALAARELTGTFKAQNADELLNVLSEMLDMDIDPRDNKVYLNPRP
jgi:transmembrane sensor